MYLQLIYTGTSYFRDNRKALDYSGYPSSTWYPDCFLQLIQTEIPGWPRRVRASSQIGDRAARIVLLRHARPHTAPPLMTTQHLLAENVLRRTFWRRILFPAGEEQMRLVRIPCDNMFFKYVTHGLIEWEQYPHFRITDTNFNALGKKLLTEKLCWFPKNVVQNHFKKSKYIKKYTWDYLFI